MSIVSKARTVKHRLLVARKSVSAEGRVRSRLRRNGVILDDTVFASETAHISRGVHIGSHSWVNDGATIDGPTKIGSHVGIAPGVFICTGTHEIGPRQRRAGANITLPVTIGDGCWIGANATVLPGVTIGKGCVIAAGAVVIEDCAPDGLYAGVPARRVKDLG